MVPCSGTCNAMAMENQQQQQTVKEIVDSALFLAERTRKAAEDADSFKHDCLKVAAAVDSLLQTLRSAARLPPAAVCERPMRRIVTEVIRNLDRALVLVRKCRRSNALRRLITITNVADFERVTMLLKSSIGDMKWLLDVSNSSSGCALGLPPIASTDPILSWVWSHVALLQNAAMDDRTEAANGLASLAADNARNGKIIIEEGGVAPLLKLLKDGCDFPDAQLASIRAIASLASDAERVAQISRERAVPAIVQCLAGSPPSVQAMAASLVAEMALHDPLTREEFARVNAIRPLVIVLSSANMEDVSASKPVNVHSLVQSGVRVVGKGTPGRRPSTGAVNPDQLDPTIRLQLLVNSSRAVWMLAKGSVANSRRITETSGLMCLAKAIEKEHGDLQYNCLMAVSEIAAAAESNADLRRVAFKTNSAAARAVIDQLIRLVEEASPRLQIPAIRSLGCLSRTFPARETRVLRPLVHKLMHQDTAVIGEVAFALGKFATPDNFLCRDHSKAIIEFGGVPPLMRLLKSGGKAQLAAMILLCHLAIHVSNSEELKQARVLAGLQLQSAQYPSYKELIQKAIYQLNLYHDGNENTNRMHDR